MCQKFSIFRTFLKQQQQQEEQQTFGSTRNTLCSYAPLRNNPKEYVFLPPDLLPAPPLTAFKLGQIKR